MCSVAIVPIWGRSHRPNNRTHTAGVRFMILRVFFIVSILRTPVASSSPDPNTTTHLLSKVAVHSRSWMLFCENIELRTRVNILVHDVYTVCTSCCTAEILFHYEYILYTSYEVSSTYRIILSLYPVLCSALYRVLYYMYCCNISCVLVGVLPVRYSYDIIRTCTPRVTQASSHIPFHTAAVPIHKQSNILTVTKLQGAPPPPPVARRPPTFSGFILLWFHTSHPAAVFERSTNDWLLERCSGLKPGSPTNSSSFSSH